MEQREFSGKISLAASQYGVERDYWLKKLSGNLVKTRFPASRNLTGEIVRGPGEAVNITCPEALISWLMKIGKGSDFMLHMIFTAIVVALLDKYNYSENRDITVGAPIYRQDIQGKLLNTALALRNQVRDGMSFKELLLQVRQTIVEANENQNYPIETLVYQLNMTITPIDFPLFDVVILLENIHDPGYIEHTHPNMVFSFAREGEYIRGRLEYNPQLYDEQTVRQIVSHFILLLEAVLFNLDRPLDQVEILSGPEKEELLFTFNETGSQYPYTKTIDQLFTQQAVKCPDRAAVIGENGILTYKALEQMARHLAVVLLFKGVKEEEAVAVVAERSIEMAVGILAILKAGGAYLPIDPDFPEKRKKYIIAESCVRILLTDQSGKYPYVQHVHRLAPFKDLEDIHQPDNFEKSFTADADHMAYIIYTSGSTGESKGVIVRHFSVVRLVKNTNFIEFLSEDRILQTGALEFDASTFEIWGSLLNGLQLILVSRETILTAETLTATILRQGATIMWMTSALFNQMLDSDIGMFGSLRVLLVGGDVLSPAHINRLRQQHPRLRVVNGYGPTENTTFSLTHFIDQTYTDSIPIGKPIANSSAYIFDRNNHLTPVGVPGELAVGGDGLARGYLNNPELTFERFILATKSQSHKDVYLSWCPGTLVAKLYKTGDLARWLRDGTCEFLGRLDQQVKIRGYRIEPGEIENRLTSIKVIKDAAVITLQNEQGEKYLCAYIVPASPGAVDTHEIREILSRHLPDYMVPSHYVELEKIPLTPNGKVDRKALPEPKTRAWGSDYRPPRSAAEKKLAALWSEVLNIDEETISIDADFFELGGHSLKATMLISNIHKALNVKVPLAEIFRTPTIRELAQYIRGSEEIKYASIRPVEQKEYYPLSSAQKRLFILQYISEVVINYNIPEVAVLEGDLEVERISAVFGRLIGRHESLRTSFMEVDDEPIQKIHEAVEFEIEYHDLYIEDPGSGIGVPSSTEIDEIIKAFIRVFDLAQAPLFRVGLIKTGPSKHILMLDIHHIITDGTSMLVFVKEVMALYAGEKLPVLKIQYKDFSEWQNRLLKSGGIKVQEEYWRRLFSGQVPVLNLPYDYARPAIMSFSGRGINFELSPRETEELTNLALKEGVTLFMLLLAIYNVVLWKLSSQEDIIIGTPSAGRKHADLQQVMGMFVNTLALRNCPGGGRPFNSFLKEVRIRTLEAFENQDYQFEDLVEHVSVDRDVGRNPVFSVMFVLQNMDIQEGVIPEVEIPGLKLGPYRYNTEIAKFDMLLMGMETGKKLILSWQYAVKLFKESSIRRYIKYFKEIIKSVLENRKVKLSKIRVLTAEERQQILYDFNNTAAPYPGHKTMHELFREQAGKTPGNIAVTGMESGMETGNGYMVSLSYREFNRRTNRLARALRFRGVKPGSLVAVTIDRLPCMVEAVMGILKAGGAYVPLPPHLPGTRIAKILKDLDLGHIITNGCQLPEVYLLARSAKSVHTILCPDLDSIGNPGDFAPGIPVEENLVLSTDIETYPGDNLNPLAGPGDIAYIMFTSGSTGTPKGVIEKHTAVVNTLDWVNKMYNVGSADRLLFVTSLNFDLSVYDIFGILAAGASLRVASGNEIMDPKRMLDLLFEEGITFWNSAPQTLQQLVPFLPEAGKQNNISNLRLVFLSGDWIPLTMPDSLREIFKDLKIINLGGATETSIWSIYYPVDSIDPSWASIPYGTPMQNSRYYILDQDLQPCLIGVPGSIFIGGLSLASGYINDVRLTNRKYLDNPFVPGDIIYDCGDLGRYYEDGKIEFLGRKDQQVKIRGYRIELGEIESQLLKHEKIEEAIVMPRTDRTGEKYLCAYIVPASVSTLTSPQLAEYLSRELPDYMIPVHFVQLERIPLSPNGKVDRKALPEPGTAAVPGNYTSPANHVEEILVNIWSEVLGIPPGEIGTTINFFHLGGHSLKATIMISKIYRELQVKISLGDVFQTPFIKQLAERISSSAKDIYTPADENVVLLKKGADNARPLFFIHDGSCEVEGYLEFCQRLNNTYNCWGIRARDIENFAPGNITIEEVAKEYIRMIKKIQPHPPYSIAGWSLGGIIAFEMVRQMETMKEDVAFFAMIDTAPPGGEAKKMLYPGRFTVESELEWIRRIWPDFERENQLKSNPGLDHLWPAIVRYLEQNGFNPDTVKSVFPANMANIIPNYHRLGIKELIYHLNRIRTFEKAKIFYKPGGELGIPVHYFAASTVSGEMEYKEKWNGYCRTSINFYEVEGDHFSIFKEPEVDAFAKLFEKVIGLNRN